MIRIHWLVGHITAKLGALDSVQHNIEVLLRGIQRVDDDSVFVPGLVILAHPQHIIPADRLPARHILNALLHAPAPDGIIGTVTVERTESRLMPDSSL